MPYESARPWYISMLTTDMKCLCIYWVKKYCLKGSLKITLKGKITEILTAQLQKRHNILTATWTNAVTDQRYGPP